MGNFDQLPSDVVLDIITRLPTETVLDCKLVCKPWKKLISHHPSFIQLHSNRLLNQSSDSTGESGFLVLSHIMDLYYFEYKEKHDDTPASSIRRINLTSPFRPLNFDDYKIVGSFNGLVCLYGGGEYAYCICNPVTKEYVMLPKIEIDYHEQFSSGFGYVPCTNEYKVVQLMVRKEYRRFLEVNVFVEVFVYTLGSGKGWRNVGRFDYDGCDIYERFRVYAECGVFLNGVLHWAHKEGGKMFTVDLAQEKFEYLSPPDLPPDRKWFGYTVGVLDGVLYYAVGYYSQSLKNTFYDIWLLEKKKNVSDMREQVEQEAPLGWHKEFSSLKGLPFAFTKCGGVLCVNYTSISIYDPVASALKTLVSFYAFKQVIRYKTTLVSLKGLAAAEEDIRFMELGHPHDRITRPVIY